MAPGPAPVPTGTPPPSASRAAPASRTRAGPRAAASPNRPSPPSPARSTHNAARRVRPVLRRPIERSRGSTRAAGPATRVGGFSGALLPIIGFVPVNFVPLAPGSVARALPFMQSLYRREHIDYDPDRTLRSAEWLLDHPDWGGIWIVTDEGRDAGYFAITVSSSIEFQGRFAILDELYIADEWRGRGVGPAVVAFVVAMGAAAGLRRRAPRGRGRELPRPACLCQSWIPPPSGPPSHDKMAGVKLFAIRPHVACRLPPRPGSGVRTRQRHARHPGRGIGRRHGHLRDLHQSRRRPRRQDRRRPDRRRQSRPRRPA